MFEKIEVSKDNSATMVCDEDKPIRQKKRSAPEDSSNASLNVVHPASKKHFSDARVADVNFLLSIVEPKCPRINPQDFIPLPPKIQPAKPALWSPHVFYQRLLSRPLVLQTKRIEQHRPLDLRRTLQRIIHSAAVAKNAREVYLNFWDLLRDSSREALKELIKHSNAQGYIDILSACTPYHRYKLARNRLSPLIVYLPLNECVSLVKRFFQQSGLALYRDGATIHPIVQALEMRLKRNMNESQSIRQLQLALCEKAYAYHNDRSEKRVVPQLYQLLEKIKAQISAAKPTAVSSSLPPRWQVSNQTKYKNTLSLLSLFHSDMKSETTKPVETSPSGP